jgi:hypothetical protein
VERGEAGHEFGRLNPDGEQVSKSAVQPGPGCVESPGQGGEASPGCLGLHVLPGAPAPPRPPYTFLLSSSPTSMRGIGRPLDSFTQPLRYYGAAADSIHRKITARFPDPDQREWEVERSVEHIRLNRTQRALIAVVVAGAVVIAGIGFAGSYSAVRELAIRKGFGNFATVFPIGVDAGIAVLLALDLLLTWLRIPFPMLRQAAWLLTAATIGFNAAAAWPDPVGVGMHAVIPILFVVTVEAARHAVGRLAAITADRHMEGVRLWRWILAPLPTFRLWRRMMLWEIRKYDDVILAEQQRLIYQTRLRGRYGRGWRWTAPVEELLPLRIARYGVPLEEAPVPSQPQTLAAGVKDTRQQENPGAAKVIEGPDEGHSDGGGEKPERQVPPEADSQEKQEDQPGADPAEAGIPSAVNQRPAPTAAPAPVTPPPTPRDGETVPVPASPGRGEAKPEGEHPGRDRGTEPSTRTAAPEPAHPTQGSEAQAGQREREPDLAHQGDSPGTVPSEHEAAIERLTSNAAAVRYAMRALGSTHTPTVVDWLAAHGREVNRGQAHRITKEEAERQQRGQRLTVVKSTS